MYIYSLSHFRLRELEDLLEELEAAKRLEVVAKIEERKKKKAEQRRGFNDVTDMAKMNSDYSIDDALLFIEGQLSRKKKGKNFKKENLKQLEKRTQNTKAKVVKKNIEAERMKERIELSQSDAKVKVNKTKPKNKCKLKKKSNSSMFDEIVGDIIDELGQFERNEESKAKKHLKSSSAVKQTETAEYFDVAEEVYWTKVGGTTDCNKKIKVKKVKTPQIFTVVDVDHENLRTSDISDRTISAKLKDSPKVKSNAWMETNQTLLENKNNDLSEEDFPILQSPRQRMLEKTSSPKKWIDLGEEVDLEDEKAKVFVDANLLVGSKDEAGTEMYKEEVLRTEVELKVSGTTNIEDIKNHAYQEEVDIKNLSIQEEIVGEDQMEEEKVEKLGEKEGMEDLTKNQNHFHEEVAENQNQEENMSENSNQEEVSKKPKQEEEVSEKANEEEVSKKSRQTQLTRVHAMLSGLIVPFGQF